MTPNVAAVLSATITWADDEKVYVAYLLDGREVDCDRCDYFRDGVGRWCERYRMEPRFCRWLTIKGQRLATPVNCKRIDTAARQGRLGL